MQCPLASSRRGGPDAWPLGALERRSRFGFHGPGGLEVLVGYVLIGDTGIDESHPRRAVTQQGGDRFEAHPSVEALGRQCVTKLVGMNFGDAGSVGDTLDISVDGAPVEGLAVVRVRGGIRPVTGLGRLGSR